MSIVQTQDISAFNNLKIITVEWTAEADASFISATITGCRGMYLIAVKTFPTWNDEGNPLRAPAADYDITLTDADQLEVTGTALGDRSATAAEIAFPAQMSRPIDSDLTLAITGNTSTHAKGTIKLYLSPIPTAIVDAAAE
jgi:hypothetical protein